MRLLELDVMRRIQFRYCGLQFQHEHLQLQTQISLSTFEEEHLSMEIRRHQIYSASFKLSCLSRLFLLEFTLVHRLYPASIASKLFDSFPSLRALVWIPAAPASIRKVKDMHSEPMLHCCYLFSDPKAPASCARYVQS